MQTCWFVVIYSAGTWWVDCEGRAFGPFASQAEAEQGALDIAGAFGDGGRRPLIYSPDGSGRPRLYWSGPDANSADRPAATFYPHEIKP